MGFFLTEEQAARLGDKPRSPPRKKAPIELGAKGCDNCPLQESWSRLTSPCMKLSGNVRDPDILVLGEAPGEDEDKEGVAFIGQSGRLLRSVIPGRDLKRLAFQNTVRCHPYKNATPSAQAVHACSDFLAEDFLAHDFKAILGVGSVPLQYVFPGAQITRVHGTRFVVDIGGKLVWYWPVFHPSFVLQTGGERSANYPVFRADVREFFHQVDNWKAPKRYSISPADVLLPANEVDARALIARMEGPLGFDIETGTDRASVLRPYKHGARVLTAAFSDSKLTVAFPVAHPDGMNDWGLRLLLEAARDRSWIAHNAQFELIWLLYFGRQADPGYEPAPFDDSMALARAFHERNTILSLDDVSRIHLGTSVKDLTDVNPRMIMSYPLDKVLPYNGIDAWASATIYHRLIKRLPHRDTYHRFLETIRSTAEMEYMGLDADLSATANMQKAWSLQLEDAIKRAKTLYEVRMFEMERQTEFSLSNPAQVGEALATYAHVPLPRTKDGGYSTDEEHLRTLAEDNPLARAVLDFREAQKIQSTYFEATVNACKENVDGRLHPQYSTLRTYTTRLSSEEPNIQNWPKRRHREVRAQIVAPKGHLLCAMDAKQLEARVFGMASKDRALCSSIISGEDIHTYWLNKILNRYPDYVVRLMEKTNEATEKAAIKAGRDIIKTDFVFASFYGSIARSCAERTGLPLVIVEEVLYEFWERYEGARRWGQEQRRLYQDKGSARLLTGFMRHGVMPGNEPYNTPIQGTGAQLILATQNALSQLSREHKDPYLHPRINIHDDLTFILPDDPDLLEAYIEVIVPEFIKIRYPWQIVPLAVEVKVGPNWANLEYVADFTGDYVR